MRLRLALAAIAIGILVPTTIGQTPPAEGDRIFRSAELPGYENGELRLMMYVPTEPIVPAKTSPVHGWTYDYAVTGLARMSADSGYNSRFRVFTQTWDPNGDLSEGVLRLMLRLWDFNTRRLRLDHRVDLHLRSVDVYLSREGRSGAEQIFAIDEESRGPDGRASRVNTIHVYDLATFTQNSLEMCREIAHEYGHATLPPIGIYTEPEDWANGDLGERIYLQWLRREMDLSGFTPSDTLGATANDLDRYIAANVTPLVAKVGTFGPDFAGIARKDRAGYDAYLGLALYAEQILPEPAFARSLVLTGTQSALDYVKAVENAVAEREESEIRIPAGFRGQAIWVPLGSGQIEGAKVLRTERAWAKVQPTAQRVLIRHRQD